MVGAVRRVVGDEVGERGGVSLWSSLLIGVFRFISMRSYGGV